MGRSLLVVECDRAGEPPLPFGHPQHRVAAESGTGLEAYFLVNPADLHRFPSITAISGIRVARQYTVTESVRCSTPRLRCRRSFRKPYNLRMHATVGVGLAADRKRRRSPTARDTARYTDKRWK